LPSKWFLLLNVLRDLLAEMSEAEQPRPAPPPTPMGPADHQAHLRLDPLSGAQVFCCPRHDREFEDRCHRVSRAPDAMDHLSREQRAYIAARLGTRR
jgi:hypothetical protein